MKRSALSLEKEALSWIYQNTTLIISVIYIYIYICMSSM